LNSVVPNLNLLNLLERLWCHLDRRRQFQLVLLLGLMLVGALAEVVSLGAVLPFISVLVAPEKVFNHPAVVNILPAWGIGSANELVLPFTVLFVCLALIAGAIRLFLLWVNNRLTVAIGTDLSLEVYRCTLYQPYNVHIACNSSEVVSGIINKVHSVVFGVILQILTLISSVLLLTAITITLITIDPMVASVAVIGFGSLYGLITIIVRPYLRRNSERVAHEQTQLIKALQEGLGGIRDVLLSGAQSVYSDIYRRADYPMRRAYGSNLFIGQSPRFVMEALGMVLIALLAYGLSYKDGIASALPVLGALVLGAQRLIPALQHSYAAWSSIVGSQGSLADIVALLDRPIPEEILVTESTGSPLSFQNSISFKSVRFRFSDDGPWVLDGFNLTISKGARVGFVGSTGSGKSTTLDLLMGLLMPVEGEFLVDGQCIRGNLVRAWQRTVAHVPQSIYLADSTFFENIAFGVPVDEIDMGRVRNAARQAQIADFIESGPEGYDAFVGERGIRLSGGQRQRIGIARALYKQASVLVLDEATSALDNTTEQSVMDAIEGLSRNLTILLIAHRISTVRHCDNIVELSKGRVTAQGTYEQMLAKSPSFNRMVNTSE
jgi:ATP-binding cassette, subfamily B, bacterial PglK